MPDSWDYTQKPQRTSTSFLAQTPILTYALCLFCIALTIPNLYPNAIPNEALNRFAQSAVLKPSDIWNGHYGALFTAVFVHGSPLHILFNLLWLWRLGSMVELTIGPLAYAAFFFVATIVSSCADLALGGDTGIGASGAVYAIFGLMWAGRGRYPTWRTIATKDTFNLFVIWGVFCVFTTWLHLMNIANFAHGGGFLFGLAVGKVFLAPRRDFRYVVPLVGLAALCVCAVLWLPWSSDWNVWKGDKEVAGKNYQAAFGYYNRALHWERDARGRARIWLQIAQTWNIVGRNAESRNDVATMQKAVTEEEAAMQKGYAEADRMQKEEATQQEPFMPQFKKNAPGAAPKSDATPDNGER